MTIRTNLDAAGAPRGLRGATDGDAAPAGVPAASQAAVVQEGMAVGMGVLAGAVTGAIAGPLGMAVGASLGAVIGEVAGRAIHEREDRLSLRDHELDDAIGVTSGPIGAGPVLGFVEPAKGSSFLRSDHDLLDSLGELVLGIIAEGDRQDVGAAVADIQARIRAHLDGEERELIPAYALHAPQDAALLLEEHAEMRRALSELDVATDLHLVRVDALRAMLARLKEHAAREEAGMYRWAATAPDPPV